MTDLIKEINEIKAGMPAREPDDVFPLRDKLYAIADRVSENPALLTDAVLDGLAAIAGDSPFRDIHDPGAELHHRQNPAQDVCLVAVRLFETLAAQVPDKAGQVVARLESLARDNLDYDIRQQAVMDLWVLSLQSEPLRSFGVAALERQGAENSCSYIRTICRDNLLQTAKEIPELASRAWTAQAEGTVDEDRDARVRALALLTNRVKEKDCSYAEAENLMTLFRKAAAKAGSEEEAVKYWADQGVGDIQERRMTELVERGCSTLDDVQPFKPIKLKAPGNGG